MKPRPRGWSTPVAIVGFAASAILLAATAWLLTQTGMSASTLSAPDLAMALTYPAVGAVLVARRPGNRIGQLLLVAGVSAATQTFTSVYGWYAIHVRPHAVPGGVWALWVSNWAWVPAFTSLALFLVLLYPTGHVASARWRLLAWLNAGLVVALLLIAALHPGPLTGDSPTEPANPVGVAFLSGADDLVFVLFLAALASMLAGVVGLVLRFRHAPPVERAQLKWFAFSAGVAAMALLAEGVSAERFSEAFGADVLDVIAGIAIAGLALAVGIAIMRYRLYDIDRLISRTVSYAVITALLLAVYVTAVTLGSRLAPGGSSIAVAASTLAVAALFHPLRRSVQLRVDRQFNRARYDAERTVDSFTRRLRGETNLDAVSADLLGVVRSTMQPAHASLWLADTISVR